MNIIENKNGFCEKCRKEVDCDIHEEKRTFRVAGKPYVYDSLCATCPDCGTVIHLPAIDDENSTRLYKLIYPKH